MVIVLLQASFVPVLLFLHMNVLKMLGFLKCLYWGSRSHQDYFQFVNMHRICRADQGPFCVKVSFEKTSNFVMIRLLYSKYASFQSEMLRCNVP